jgi:hypothetical protein
MKKTKIEQAVGMVLGHDVTQIIPGGFKGPGSKEATRYERKTFLNS